MPDVPNQHRGRSRGTARRPYRALPASSRQPSHCLHATTTMSRARTWREVEQAGSREAPRSALPALPAHKPLFRTIHPKGFFTPARNGPPVLFARGVRRGRRARHADLRRGREGACGSACGAQAGTHCCGSHRGRAAVCSCTHRKTANTNTKGKGRRPWSVRGGTALPDLQESFPSARRTAFGMQKQPV